MSLEGYSYSYETVAAFLTSSHSAGLKLAGAISRIHAPNWDGEKLTAECTSCRDETGTRKAWPCENSRAILAYELEIAAASPKEEPTKEEA